MKPDETSVHLHKWVRPNKRVDSGSVLNPTLSPLAPLQCPIDGCSCTGVRGSKLHIWAFEKTKSVPSKGMNT